MKVEEYHGILVDVSQKDKTIFRKLNILSQKKDGSWVLYKVGISPKQINKQIKQLQNNMVDGFYFHFYRENKLIVVFKKRIFKVKTDKSTWKDLIEYGKSLNIPEEQLDFFPCKISEENYLSEVLHKIRRFFS